MITAKLVRVVMGADFRKSETTLLNELPRDVVRSLGDKGVVCFVNTARTMVRFAWAGARLGEGTAYHSIRWRLDGGHWEPLAIADYAQRCGLKLEGLKTLREHFEHLQREVRRAS